MARSPFLQVFDPVNCSAPLSPTIRPFRRYAPRSPIPFVLFERFPGLPKPKPLQTLNLNPKLSTGSCTKNCLKVFGPPQSGMIPSAVGVSNPFERYCQRSANFP